MMVSRQLDRLPEPVRRVVRAEVQVVNRRLRAVRRPRDLRRLLNDPVFVNDLASPLAPALDQLLTLAVKGTVPISPRFASTGATTTAVVGATVESIMEVAAVLGVEVPPLAATIAGSAVGVGIAVQLIEFYLTASMAWSELRDGGVADVAVLRRVILAAYVGDDRRAGGDLAQLGLNRLAAALVKRAVPGFIPLAGIPIAGVSAHRAQKRAHAAVVAEIAAARRTQ